MDAQGKYRNGTAAVAAAGSHPVKARAEGKMLVKRSAAAAAAADDDDASSLEEDEREASGEEDEEGRGRLSTRSAKFAELKPRRGEEVEAGKGWIGWLRRL